MKLYKKFLRDYTAKERYTSRLKRALLVLAASALTLSVFVVPTTAAYDPSKDPLVTVSYLNAEKAKIKTEVEQSILSKLGFSSFEELKNAINSGGGGSVNETSIVEKAKNGVLNELGYTTYAKLKEAIQTVSTTEKSNISSMVQSAILTQLGFKTMAELKAKINESAAISQSDMDIIVGKVKAEMLKELGYPSFASLKKAIDNTEGGGVSPAEAVQYFIQQLGYSSVADLKKDLEKITNTPSQPDTSEPVTSQPIIPVTGGYETVVLKRGQTIIVESNCEAIPTNGIVGIIGNYINSGVADITAGAIIGNNDTLVVGHSYIIPKPENGYALICVSTEAVIFIRGDYEID